MSWVGPSWLIVSSVFRGCRVWCSETMGGAENARLENAGLELSAPNCRGGKCGTGIIGNRKRMERDVWHNIVFSYKHMVHIWAQSNPGPPKRLKKIGLTAAYQNEEDSQVVFRCLMALPLLPVVDIVPGFQDVKALVKPDSASQVQLLQLCRYVERQWITKASIARLCVRDNTSRTNNAVESFHAGKMDRSCCVCSNK